MEDLLNKLKEEFGCKVEFRYDHYVITPPNFKQGDILISSDNETIVIFKEYTTSNLIFSSFANTQSYDNNQGWYTKYFRRANTKEVGRLYDFLKEHGRKWNARTCQLEKLKWKPKFGDSYYFLDYDKIRNKFYTDSNIHSNGVFDNKIANEGHPFQTFEECIEICNKLNEAIKNIK